MVQSKSKKLSENEKQELLRILKSRFEINSYRHQGMQWSDVEARIKSKPDKLWSLHEMERTGGEPALVTLDKDTGEFIFIDCSPESPSGRRSLCYDQTALESRKANKPSGSVTEMANAMGIEILNEEQYFKLQESGNFDIKTSSWLKTPSDVRKLGGALFGDFRFGRVFIYHNGAESYYATRGFRGYLRV